MITHNTTKINIIFNNPSLQKDITYLFNQKNIIIENNVCDELKSINISKTNNHLDVIFNGQIVIKVKLPSSFDKMFKSVFQILPQVYLNFYDTKYYPYVKKIETSNKNVLLNETHNIILSSLVTSKGKTLKKNDLYQFLWPNDKIVSLNKLDTHLTNLKNFLKLEMNQDLRISSSKGIIALLD